jgi:hypothetical protein
MLLFQLFTEMNISFAQEWGEAAIDHLRNSDAR